MGHDDDGERASWLRGLLIAERKRKKWSSARTAKAIGRVTGEGLTRQAFAPWEKGEVTPKVDTFAAWASALGLHLDIQLLREGEDVVMVRLPSDVVPDARELSVLDPEDRRLIMQFVSRLKHDPE